MAPEDSKPNPGPDVQRQDLVYGKPPGAGDWRRITRMVALVLMVAYVVLFFLLNRESVEVSLVVTTATIPLVWVLLGTFVLGALVMYLLLYLRQRAGRKAQAKQ